MRTLLAAVAASLALLGASAARGEAPPKLELVVGEDSASLGILGRCDDLSVATLTPNGRGLRGLKPGATICSFDTSGGGGIRRIYTVVVKAPPPPPPPPPPPSAPGEAGAPGAGDGPRDGEGSSERR